MGPPSEMFRRRRWWCLRKWARQQLQRAGRRADFVRGYPEILRGCGQAATSRWRPACHRRDRTADAGRAQFAAEVLVEGFSIQRAHSTSSDRLCMCFKMNGQRQAASASLAAPTMAHPGVRSNTISLTHSLTGWRPPAGDWAISQRPRRSFSR